MKKMKIGILTFHAAHNYGAVLQCYALKEYLQSLGHEVSIIDYRQEYLLGCYKWFNLKTLLKAAVNGNLFTTCRNMLTKKTRGRKFDDFTKRMFDLSDPSLLNTEFYDYVVIGSDQVWSTKLTNGYDDYYWGQFKHPIKTKIISYAASLEILWPEKEDFIVKSKLKAFYRISTREKELAHKIHSLLPGKEVVTCVDPTLLLDCEKWGKLAKKPNIKEKYIFYYQVRHSQMGLDFAKKVSHEKKCKLLVLSADVKNENTDDIKNASPEELLGLIKYADCVISSSFHGTVFSVIFKKQFFSISNGTKDSRVRNLLEGLHLMNHFVESSDFDIDVSTIIDDNKLQDYIKSSVEYLKQIK